MKITKFLLFITFVCFFFNPNIFAKEKESFSHLVTHGKYKDIEKAIKKGANLDERTTFGLTPLMMALKNQDPKVVELIISSGADVNAETFQGWTTLFYAVEFSTDDIVPIIEVLVKSGANLEHKLSSGQTPLSYASEINRNINIHRKLIELGADIESKNVIGITPIFYAAGYNTYDVYSFLLSKGASIRDHNNNKKNILFYAAPNKRYASLNWIKEIINTKQIDINEVDDTGVNILMYCVAAKAKKEIVEEIILNTANINQQDENGVTALMASCIVSKDTEIIELLLFYGADINLQTNQNIKAKDYILQNSILKDTVIVSKL